MAKIRITENYKRVDGLTGYIERLKEGGYEGLKVGILKKPDNRVYSRADDPKETLSSTGQRRDRLTLSAVAYILETGWGPIAARPFIRPALSERKDELTDNFAKYMAKVGKNKNYTIGKALGALGRDCVEVVKDYIHAQDFVPLKDPTRQGRFPAGDAEILMDTYELINSIGYQKVKE